MRTGSRASKELDTWVYSKDVIDDLDSITGCKSTKSWEPARMEIINTISVLIKMQSLT